MRPILFEWGGLVIPSLGFFLAIGFWIGSFVFWRRLRDEYDQESLMTLSILSGILGLTGARLWVIFFEFGRFGWNAGRWISLISSPGLSLYGAIFGVLIAVILFSWSQKWLFGEVWDAVVEAGLWTILIGAFGAFLSGSWVGKLTSLGIGADFVGWEGKRHPVTIYLLAGTVILIFLNGWVRRNYRRFRLYPSGKPGFVGLVLGCFFSIALFAIELFKEGGIYLGGLKIEQWILIIVFLLSLVKLYKLSGRKWVQDREAILRKLRFKIVTVKQKSRQNKHGKEHKV